jgi:uncharacterized protein (DUF488 family)
MSEEIWTIGHSNRPWQEFLELLQEHAIQRLVDIRRFPGSRTHPQFNQGPLEENLTLAGLDYRHLGSLGGRRTDRLPNSPNAGWRVDAFNRYADYMATEPFQAGLCELETLARERRTAMMCSEAVPWRCHRRLVADALMTRGWTVFDIVSRAPAKPHSLTPFARVRDGRLSYPAEQQELPLFESEE